MATAESRNTVPRSFVRHSTPDRAGFAGAIGSNVGQTNAARYSGIRRILHLDVDAFLASVESAVHPELAGKPLVIGGLPTDRNIVMSSSYEARAFGVRPGLLLSEAKRRCPHAIFRRGDAQAANRLRDEVTRTLMRYSPTVEVASIDDFFVDLTGTERLLGPALEVAAEIRGVVRDEVRLPLTIGVGTNITIARLAGKLAKPGAVAEIRPGYEAAFLSDLPVEHLPGVGHKTRALLERFRIRTVGELRAVSREVLFASFGHGGLVLFERARGIDPDPVEPTWIAREDGVLERRAPRSIRRDSTFEPEEGDRAQVEAMLAYLVERAAYKLRQLALVAGTIEVHVRYVDTRPPSVRRAQEADRTGRNESEPRRARRTLDLGTDSTDELWRIARDLLRSLPRRRALTKRIGLELTKLGRRVGWQQNLFSDPGDEHASAGTSHADRQRQLDTVLDDLRARHGFGGMLRGSSLPLSQTHEWGDDGFRLRTPSLNQ